MFEEIDVCPDLDATRMHVHYQNITGSSYLCVTLVYQLFHYYHHF